MFGCVQLFFNVFQLGLEITAGAACRCAGSRLRNAFLQSGDLGLACRQLRFKVSFFGSRLGEIGLRGRCPCFGAAQIRVIRRAVFKSRFFCPGLPQGCISSCCDRPEFGPKSLDFVAIEETEKGSKAH